MGIVFGQKAKMGSYNIGSDDPGRTSLKFSNNISSPAETYSFFIESRNNIWFYIRGILRGANGISAMLF